MPGAPYSSSSPADYVTCNGAQYATIELLLAWPCAVYGRSDFRVRRTTRWVGKLRPTHDSNYEKRQPSPNAITSARTGAKRQAKWSLFARGYMLQTSASCVLVVAILSQGRKFSITHLSLLMHGATKSRQRTLQPFHDPFHSDVQASPCQQHSEKNDVKSDHTRQSTDRELKAGR